METAGRADNVLVGIELSERGHLAKIVEEKAEATDGIALDITDTSGRWCTSTPTGVAANMAKRSLKGFDGILQVDGLCQLQPADPAGPQGRNADTACVLLGALSVPTARNLQQQRLGDRGRGPAPDRRGLYAIEAGIRGNLPEQRLAQVPPRREARLYRPSLECCLQFFLADGRVEIDSNRVENLAKPLDLNLNRKNAFFAGYDAGVVAWARMAISRRRNCTASKPVHATRPHSKPSLTAPPTAAPTSSCHDGTSSPRRAESRVVRPLPGRSGRALLRQLYDIQHLSCHRDSGRPPAVQRRNNERHRLPGRQLQSSRSARKN